MAGDLAVHQRDGGLTQGAVVGVTSNQPWLMENQMHRKRKVAIGLSAAIAALFGTLAVAEPGIGEYDALPAGAPDELAQRFRSALDMPGIEQWPAEDKRQLLAVVTVRYENRLTDRPPPATRERTQRYVERLAKSPLAEESPRVVRQTCTQYGFTEGVCAAHAGYTLRALVLEEMLARRSLSLDQLETELLGEPRPKVSAWSAD